MAAPIEEEIETSVLDEHDDVPEHLNPMSPKFDPMRALYDRQTPIPAPDAKQFNNVAEFENFLKGKDSKTMLKKKTSKKEELPGIIAVRAAAQAKEAVRKAAIMAKSAGPSVRSKTQERRNRSSSVFTRMEGYKKGPLSLLRKCVGERLRVIVVVRAAVAVRSRCRGYVIGFDKHFNMALMDVDEKFIRPVPKKKTDGNQSVEERSSRDSPLDEKTDRLSLQSSESSHRSHVRYKDVGNRHSHVREGGQMLDLRGKLQLTKFSDRKSELDSKELSSSQEILYGSSDSEICKSERSRSKDRLSALQGHSDKRSRSKDSGGSQSRNQDDPKKFSISSDSYRKYSSSNEDIARSKTSDEKRLETSKDKRSKDFKGHYHNYMSDSNVYVKREQKRWEEKSSKSDSEWASTSVSKDKQRKADKNMKRQFQPFWPLYKKWTESRCYAEYEIVTRHINQLFIRGDNVVSISIADC